jgi:hypothetical protein
MKAVRVRAWAFVVFVLALAAAYFMLHREAAPPAVADTTTGDSTPAPVLLPQGHARAAPGASAPAAAVQEPRYRVPASGEVEVCGRGPMHRALLDSKAGEPDPLAQPRQDGIDAVAAALAKGDALEQAAAALLRGTQGTTAVPVQAEAVVRIAELARGSDDLDLWLLALRACAQPGQRPPRACTGFDLLGWARRDPGNGAPWLAMATEARIAGQMQAYDDAMYRMSQADFIDFRTSAPARVLGGLDIAPAHELGALAASISLAGFGTAAGLPPYQTVVHYCSVPALVDVNRRLRCDELAALLAERGNSMLDLEIGRSVGAQLRWPASRLQALSEERDAYEALRAADVAQLPLQAARDRPTACAPSQRLRAAIVDTARRGELGSLRQQVAASGHTMAQLAADYRAQADRLVATPAAAASSAASAVRVP